MIALPRRTGAIVAVAAALALAIAVVASAVLLFTNYSEGYRDGVVQKFSQRRFAYFVKTWEGELALPGFGGSHRRGSGQGDATWAFSVTDPAVVREIVALPPDAYVRLRYDQVYVAAPWKGATDYRVTAVERVDPGSAR